MRPGCWNYDLTLSDPVRRESPYSRRFSFGDCKSTFQIKKKIKKGKPTHGFVFVGFFVL